MVAKEVIMTKEYQPRNLIFDKRRGIILENVIHSFNEDGSVTIIEGDFSNSNSSDKGACVRNLEFIQQGDYVILPEVILKGVSDRDNYFVYGDVVEFNDDKKSKNLLFLPMNEPVCDPEVGYREIGNIFEDTSIIEKLTGNKHILNYYKAIINNIRN